MALGSAAAAAMAGRALRDARRRERLQRSLRVARLTARRSAQWGAHKVRGAAAGEARRAELEEQYAIRSAVDVARELGNMKGAIMKIGQFLSFVLEGLPEPAQQALAQLQADAPPMSPRLAEEMVHEELGAHPHKLFLDWDPVPVAAASIGQVHKAVLRDGRCVAVKVQYPGIDRCLTADLDNGEAISRIFGAVTWRSLDAGVILDELRSRMTEELDYTLEAARQRSFCDRYRGHPFISVPEVIDEYSSSRVLTSTWVDGLGWAEFLAAADPPAAQRAAEAVFRFVQDSLYRAQEFNGDPHPGNYRFHLDGRVTFLDFGLVKRWSREETDGLWPIINPLLAGDAGLTVTKMVDAGFLALDHGLDPQHVWDYVSTPYTPFLVEEFTFSRDFVRDSLDKMLNVTGPYRDVINALNMPASFVILDRVVWGTAALLGRLQAQGPWRAILAEYRTGAPPATELGRLEQDWAAGRPAPSDAAIPNQLSRGRAD